MYLIRFRKKDYNIVIIFVKYYNNGIVYLYHFINHHI